MTEAEAATRTASTAAASGAIALSGALQPAPDAPAMGYVLTGRLPGPTLVVADHGDLGRAVVARLRRLPTLPWMRGRIVVVSLDRLGAGDQARTLGGCIGSYDRIVHLPLAGRGGQTEAAAEQGYWAVLRMAARLGMISGRGVPMGARPGA